MLAFFTLLVFVARVELGETPRGGGGLSRAGEKASRGRRQGRRGLVQGKMLRAHKGKPKGDIVTPHHT